MIIIKCIKLIFLCILFVIVTIISSFLLTLINLYEKWELKRRKKKALYEFVTKVNSVFGRSIWRKEK